MSEGNFEAKKHGYRQTQNGIIVSFLINPADPHDEIATAALGTRFVVAFSEIGVDAPVSAKTPASKPTSSAPAKPKSDPKKFSELRPSAQAGIRCADPEFWNYLCATLDLCIMSAERCAEEVRRICKVESRSEFDTQALARQRWAMVESGYMAWLETKKYAETAK